MTVEAVIFDWGGTLTPWHTVDAAGLWSWVCDAHFPPAEAARYAVALLAAEGELAAVQGRAADQRVTNHVFERAGVAVTEAFLASYVRAWEPHTFTDPDAPELLAYLGARDIRVGVLSNTLWPRVWHEEVFRRDGVLDLIDGAVYSSEIDCDKPHPEAFLAAMAAVGATDPRRCVFVGDRPLDDVYGAQTVGMRAGPSRTPTCRRSAAAPDAVIRRLRELRPLIGSWVCPAVTGRQSECCVLSNTIWPRTGTRTCSAATACST